MKCNEPSEFFKIIIEKSDINVINDEQKCLTLAPYILNSEESYFNLLKIAFIFNVYKELVKANNEDSSAKMLHIKKALNILTDECFIKDEKAILAVGWLASVIYPIEWKLFLNNLIQKKEKEEIGLNQPKSKSEITIEEKPDSSNNNSLNENKNWTLEAINLEMIYCPAGSFMMGSPAPKNQKGLLGFIGKADTGELGRYDNEIQHQVILSKPFYIGKFPITQMQYKSVIGNNPSSFKGDNNPVEGVNWNDSRKFCERLNSIYSEDLPQGFIFALPTEAQWEYACRAGTSTALNNGKNLTTPDGICPNLDEVAWYFKNSNNSTHPVGLKKPNNWGIYDMHGNVWEWCEDWYSDYIKDVVIDPKGPNSGSRRVFRGGGWFFNPLFCRSAFRRFSYPDNRGNIVGFRIALVPINTK